MRILLLPFSFLYGIGVSIRNFLYDMGILKGRRYPFPVIGVGNLRVGGTGKTPMIEYLVSMLSPTLKTAVLSRGYGRKSEGFLLADEGSTAHEVGDEPRQFKQKFPDLIVAVDANRNSGIKKLKQLEEGIQVILLDDAFQHRAVKPGFNVLLTVYNDLYIDDFLLPAGRLREPAFNAKRADAIIVTKTPPDMTHLERKAIQDRLNPKPHQEVLFTYLVYDRLRRVRDAQPATDGELGGAKRAILVSGIANAAFFEEEVGRNFTVVRHFAFGDHHNYQPKDLKKVGKEFEAAKADPPIVITTEKDAQRLAPLLDSAELAGLPLYYLPLKLAFHQDDLAKFEKLITEYVRSYQSGHPVYS